MLTHLSKTRELIRKVPFLKENLLLLYKGAKIAVQKKESKWALIKQEFSMHKPFVAPVNKLITEKARYQTSYTKPGLCYFIPHLFGKNSSIFSLLQEKNYKKILIIGNHSNGYRFQKKLRSASSNYQVNWIPSPSPTDNLHQYDAIILACRQENGLALFRDLIHMRRFQGALFIESAHEFVILPSNQIELKAPILLCSYPCAGTNRFIFGFEYLLKKLKWHSIPYSPFVNNTRYIHSLKDAQTPSDDLNNHAYNWRLKTLDYFQCLSTHEWFSLDKICSEECEIVVLMRDPRDIINSFYWHTIQEAQNPSEHIYNIMKGYTRFYGENYAFNWPSANKLLDIYLEAMGRPHTHIIRFEDLYHDAPSAYKKLFGSLNLYPHPFIDITEQDIHHAVFLGSFEYQTQGLRKRGDNHTSRLKGEHSGISCRKGIVGDFRSSFTPEAIAYFKQMTGDKLIRLGYENNENWT